MGIQETLQEALVNANNERHELHAALQEHDDDLVQLKANLQRAETEKAGAEIIHRKADEKYRELLDHGNKPTTDHSHRSALSPEIQKLAEQASFTTRLVQNAGNAVRRYQREVTQAEEKRTVAYGNLLKATDCWEQIKKQITDLNR
jgi:hypothetical protein